MKIGVYLIMYLARFFRRCGLLIIMTLYPAYSLARHYGVRNSCAEMCLWMCKVDLASTVSSSL